MGEEQKKPVQMQMLIKVYETLKRIAKANHRSMSAQALVYVEEAMTREREPAPVRNGI